MTIPDSIPFKARPFKMHGIMLQDFRTLYEKKEFPNAFDFITCVHANHAIIDLFCEWYFEKYNENIVGQIALPKLRKIYETEFVDWIYKDF
jgi:hypothetical protein